MHKTKTRTMTFLLITGLLITVVPAFIQTSEAADSGWTLIYDGRGVEAYPDLKEYVWQKNATLAPNGPYDKIGLHRLVKTGITPTGVIFVLPGTWGNAEQLFSNPTEENYTQYENYSQPIYWANRGYDVYGIDYRNHFIPLDLNSSQLSFMENWGHEQWISDIKEGVDKAKEVSGTKKVFMAGISFGGRATMYYASKYWQEDLRGIILLDGGNGTTNSKPTNTLNLTDGLKRIPVGVEMGAPFTGSIFLTKYALENPGGPAIFPGTNAPLTPAVNPITNQSWANITQFFQYRLRYLMGSQTNYGGGFGDYWVTMQYLGTQDRYWPTRLNLEYIAISDWTNCPYLPYDYDDHYREINVPLIGFRSERYGQTNISRGIASPDVTGIFLPKYGHLDVFVGVYSARDVSQPTLDWMLNRYKAPAASAFCNVTLLAGQTWYFFAHSNGGIGSHTYQWYEGTTLLAGQTSMVLPVTKSTRGTFTFHCKITDSEGTTTTSNSITLTII